MLLKAIKLKASLAIYAVTNTIPQITNYEWELLQNVVKILEPFEQITRELSYRDASASEIIPTYLSLKLFFKKAQNEYKQYFKGVGTTIEEFATDLTSRFESYLDDKNLCLSTFLNPRFKIKKQKVDIDQIKTWILEHNSVESSDDNDSVIGVDNNNEPMQTAPFDLDTCFEELGNETPQQDESDETAQDLRDIQQRNIPSSSGSSSMFAIPTRTRRRLTTKEKINQAYIKEIENYASVPILARIKGELPPDILAWWNIHKSTYPLLSKLARRYLPTPPSSVESERLFSSGGHVYEDTRNRLCAEKGEQMLFLHYNMKLGLFK